MSGWAPFDVAGWPEMVAILAASGQPWPQAAAIFDLRWHVDQRIALPGRRELQNRWRWRSDDQVRRLLADPERWWDPSKGDPPTSRAELQARAPVKRRSPKSHPTTPNDHPTPPVEHPSGTGDPGQLPESHPTTPNDHPTPPVEHHRAILSSPSPPPSPPPGPAYRVNGQKHAAITEAHPDFVELLALEEEDGSQVLTHQQRDRDALLTALRQGRTRSYLRRLWDTARERGIRRLRWSTLLGEKLGDLRAEVLAMERERERRRELARGPPDDQIGPIRPPPPLPQEPT